MSELLNFILDHEAQFRRARLPSLYSDFRVQRITNPDGYTANVSAWQMALAHAAQEGMIPSRGSSNNLLILQTGQELLQALETKEWGQPLALGTVVAETIAQKHMIPLQTFRESRTSIYHRSWAGTSWQVIMWGLKHLGVASGAFADDRLYSGQFVLLLNMEEAARRLWQRVAGRTSRADRVFTKDIFRVQFAGTLNDKHDLTDMDIDVLLTYLMRDKQMIAYDGQTIKFAMSMDEACTITTEDTTIASLKTLIADLSRQVAGLTSRIDDLKIVAHDALSSKNRVSALAALRSKNLAASTLSQRSETLTQLEEIYAKIEQAADQVEIVRVMQASAGVLKSSNSQTGGVEKVEDVVEELRSEMSMVDVVGNAIVGIGQDEAMLDEGEIDDELKIMEEEQRSEKETQEAAETQRRLDELTTAARMDDGRSAKSANVSEAPHTEAKVLESAASPGPVSPEESRALWENDERKQSPAEQHTGDRLQTA